MRKKTLMVQKSSRYGRRHITRKFRIFELNFKMPEWVEKKTLSDAALFLGDNSSICVLASKLGCLYFNHDNILMGFEFKFYGPYDYGVYNVEDESILKPYTEDVKILLKKSRLPSIWVVPTCVI